MSTKQVKKAPTKEFCLKTAEYGSPALAKIYKMKQQGQLCDVTLKVGSKRYNVHKVILASISEYFFAMINEIQVGTKEKSSSVIVLRDIDAATLELLIDYVYTRQITITPDNVQVILPASDLLQIQEVTEACCQFLTEQLHPTNCLGIRAFADKHSCKELLAKSRCFVLENFQHLVDTVEFFLLTFNEVEELVSDDTLGTSSEEVVYNAVLNWIKHDLINRRQYIGKLMAHVRLPLLRKEFLTTVVDEEPLMQEDSQCKQLLFETMRYHLAPKNRSAWVTETTVKRKSKRTAPYLFVIGGTSAHNNLFGVTAINHSKCEVYNPRSETWYPIAAMLTKRSEPGVTGLDGLLYAVGGFDGVSRLATAECYNPLKNTWTPITRMNTARSGLGICPFDGSIYVCGGFDGNAYLSNMERFDPLTGIWHSCPNMRTQQGYCRIVVAENCIYAVGGSGGANYLMERFDPRLGSWSSIYSPSTFGSSIMNPLWSGNNSCSANSYGVAALNGHIYCIGGNNQQARMVKRFNIRTNAWEQISAMHNHMSSSELVTMDGCLYALSNNNNNNIVIIKSGTEVVSLNSVEKYDPEANKWFVVSSMPFDRCSVRAAVLDCVDIEDVLNRTKC